METTEKIRLLLDDYREPKTCITYMTYRLGNAKNVYGFGKWVVVKNYDEFVEFVTYNHKSIELVSFDHDLADGHYHKNMQNGVLNYDSFDFESNENKTGYHAAKWFKEFYELNNLELPYIIVHSMNPVGTENIKNVFRRIEKNK